jgi:sodium/hydrogen exchanger 8
MAVSLHSVYAEISIIGACALTVTMFVSFLILHFRLNRFLPESGATLILGIAGGIVLYFFDLSSTEYNLAPEIFYFALLPPIIFDAGFTLKKV